MVFIHSVLVMPAYIGHNYHFDIERLKHQSIIGCLTKRGL